MSSFKIARLISVCTLLGCALASFSPGSAVAAFSPLPRPSRRSVNSFHIQKHQIRSFKVLSHPLHHRKRSRLSPLSVRHYEWEGDDRRWIQRLRRRFVDRYRARTPAREALALVNIFLFCYQVVNAVNHVRRKHPSYWPREAGIIIWDVLVGTSITGPLTMDFVHSTSLSRRQPHRYLTGGFMHGSIIHLLVNMDSLRRTPTWLETDLGWPLFLTTFLVGIVSGNYFHSMSTLDNSLCLGASGGICALFGLMLASLGKMGNLQQVTRVLKNMGILLLFGYLIPNVSNAAHIGGFMGGLAMGFLCGPSYRKSYAMTRKNSLEVDPASRGYRLAMGFGKVPSSKGGFVPLYAVWLVALAWLASNPLYRRIPILIYKGLVRPGSLSRRFY